MGFKVEEVSETSHSVVVGEKLWLTADGQRLVADGDPEAAALFVSAGKRISREDAERYGLVKTKSKPSTKEAAPTEDKQAAKPADKAYEGAADEKGTTTKKATKDGG